MLMPDGCRLLIDEAGAKALACEAHETGLGARAVNSRVRSFAARARVAMECDDAIVDAVITGADGAVELAYVKGRREGLMCVEGRSKLSLEEVRERHGRVKAMKAALRQGARQSGGWERFWRVPRARRGGDFSTPSLRAMYFAATCRLSTLMCSANGCLERKRIPHHPSVAYSRRCCCM